MGQALYRKYRSRSFDEVVGQQHITDTLKNALKKDTISHAYLFTGPHGVGKTSVARLLALAVNKLPYNDQQSNLDIIEIDAASNRRIDEVRDLREKVNIAPTSGKYKVYIIDEVHMLTKEAFNALLKTLEEPPAHVIFILATTEAHKLPETIISRTQRFSFRPIDSTDITKRLEAVAKSENIKIEPKAVELIALHANGSARDALSMLDQASSADRTITKKMIEQYLGIASSESVNQILSGIDSGSPAQVLETLSELYAQGIQASQLARQLGQEIRRVVVSDNRALDARKLAMLKSLIDVPASSSPEQQLEIVILEQQVWDTKVTTKSSSADEEPNVAILSQEVEPTAQQQYKPAKRVESSDLEEEWSSVLKALRGQNNTLYGVLRMAIPEKSGSTLTLKFKFPFHQKRVSDSKNTDLIIKAFQDVTGKTFKLVCVIDETIEPMPTNEPEVHLDKSAIDNISNIFGGGEVLES